jgi:hypothetical protein
MPERRRMPRSRPHGLAARIRPGHRVAIVNVSADGALLDALTPLRPGAGVEVQFERFDHRTRISGTVVRCAVTALDAHRGPTYRAAIAFDGTFEWACEDAPHGGYGVPNLREHGMGRRPRSAK